MGVMPIPCPHFKITIVKRSQGQSAVAGAAYQSGERLFSEYDQRTKFYNKKKELVHAEVMLPSHAPPLFGLFLQSFFIGITMRILSIIIFVIVYGRMIEIYCMVSLAPIPMATWGNHEQSHMGQNYLKCLFALGFQGFLILICVAIYAVLIQSVAISGDAINSIWSIVGYTVLLCFSLFKTSSVTKSVLGAH